MLSFGGGGNGEWNGDFSNKEFTFHAIRGQMPPLEKFSGGDVVVLGDSMDERGWCFGVQAIPS